ncbi:rhodanese-like domain-containing protein [Methylomonas sp. SURF-2]|uniref:Rhodanese-like domain-containing protein n=1 Tax=Methylomonas subterranea TaxID=2952225 RepID=A0ABT1TMB4_9GAMM|nr:rhodanese-like domain-containing protein [Methylomonas sp. SURF-2]MCQ8106353.1 rhodanese-like domain-containing protein [Methylomonas sp. SURF-2]
MTKKILALTILALAVTSPASLAAGHTETKKAEAGAQRPYTAKTPKLNRAQIDALLAKPEQLLIVDVRRPDEISKIGTFPVYLNVQINELESALPFIPKERSIVTVSNHAGRAGKAGDLLLDKGFKVVGAIGSQNYEEEGGTINKIVPPAPKADEHAEHH